MSISLLLDTALTIGHDNNLRLSVPAAPAATVVFMPFFLVDLVFRLGLLLMLLVLRRGGIFRLFGHDIFKLRPERFDRGELIADLETGEEMVSLVVSSPSYHNVYVAVKGERGRD